MFTITQNNNNEAKMRWIYTYIHIAVDMYESIYTMKMNEFKRADSTERCRQFIIHPSDAYQASADTSAHIPTHTHTHWYKWKHTSNEITFNKAKKEAQRLLWVGTHICMIYMYLYVCVYECTYKVRTRELPAAIVATARVPAPAATEIAATNYATVSTLLLLLLLLLMFLYTLNRVY